MSIFSKILTFTATSKQIKWFLITFKSLSMAFNAKQTNPAAPLLSGSCSFSLTNHNFSRHFNFSYVSYLKKWKGLTQGALGPNGATLNTWCSFNSSKIKSKCYYQYSDLQFTTEQCFLGKRQHIELFWMFQAISHNKKLLQFFFSVLFKHQLPF